MATFVGKLLRNTSLLLAIGVTIASIALVVAPPDIKITIAGVFVDGLYFPFTAVDRFLTDITTTKKENERLRLQLTQMAVELARYKEDHKENQRLRRMLGFDFRPFGRLLPAEVIGSGFPGSKSLIIGVGMDQGVRVNNPVITADGIVGKIIATSRNQATVQLLTDHNCRVSALDQNTRTMGIIRWHGGRLLEMGEVPVESYVAVGDTIVSSGLGGIFPPGLRIGTVVYSKNRGGSLFKDVLVRPAVQFWTLQEVFVIIDGN